MPPRGLKGPQPGLADLTNPKRGRNRTSARLEGAFIRLDETLPRLMVTRCVNKEFIQTVESAYITKTRII